MSEPLTKEQLQIIKDHVEKYKATLNSEHIDAEGRMLRDLVATIEAKDAKIADLKAREKTQRGTILDFLAMAKHDAKKIAELKARLAEAQRPLRPGHYRLDGHIYYAAGALRFDRGEIGTKAVEPYYSSEEAVRRMVFPEAQPAEEVRDVPTTVD